jgi:hypothetical protein
MANSEVSFGCNIYQSIVSSPTIRIEYRFIKIYFSSYYGSESFSFAVRDDFSIDFHSSAYLILPFDESEYGLF